MFRVSCQFLLLLAIAPLVAAEMPLLALDIRTTAGAEVSGAFVLRADGVLHDEVGGRFYAWQEIVPSSLPVLVRQAVRKRLIAIAEQAERLYAEGKIAEAQPRYVYLHSLRHYLTAEDKGVAALVDLEQKREGRVLHEGQWVTHAEHQEELGRVEVNGDWVDREKAEIYQAFKEAFARAREADNPEDGALLLARVISEYPEAPYVQAAKALHDRLLAEAAVPLPESAPDTFNGELAQLPPLPELPRSTTYGFESSTSRYHTWDYYPPKIIINGDNIIAIPPTPRHFHRHSYGSGLRIHVGK